MASRKKKKNPRAAKKRARTRSHSGARWPRRASAKAGNRRYAGSVNDPLYRRAFAAAMRAAGGGPKMLPAPADTPPVITVYADPSPSQGSSMPRPRRKKKRRVTAEQFRAGSRFAGRVTDPLYRRALADAAKVLKGRKKKKRRGKKKKPTAAQLRARKAFAARAKARAKTSRGRKSSASRKPRAASRPASRRPTAGKKRRSSKKTKPMSRLAQVALAAARGRSTKGLSKSIGMSRWLCQGPKRSGCGSTGRVVAGRGKFVRLR